MIEVAGRGTSITHDSAYRGQVGYFSPCSRRGFIWGTFNLGTFIPRVDSHAGQLYLNLLSQFCEVLCSVPVVSSPSSSGPFPIIR